MRATLKPRDHFFVRLPPLVILQMLSSRSPEVRLDFLSLCRGNHRTFEIRIVSSGSICEEILPHPLRFD